MNEIIHLNAGELFKLRSMPNLQFPLNLEFIKRENVNALQGPGYFYLSYKNEIIYIGSYSGDEVVNDVVESRMRKQLETVTLRSSRLSLSVKALSTLSELKNFRGLTFKNEKTT